MAYWNKDHADGFDSFETKAKVDAMKEKFDVILESLGADMIKSSEMDFKDYKAAMGLIGMAKDFIEIEKAKVDALGEILDEVSEISKRLDDVERRLEMTAD